MTQPIDFGPLPPGSVIANYLFPTLDLGERHQDLVTIELPTGYAIYVGWFPEYDKNGEFWIRASWETGELKPIKVRSIPQVQQHVHALIEHYSQPSVRRTDSTSTEATFSLN